MYYSSYRVDLALLLVDTVEELILMGASRDGLTMLSDGSLELAVNLELSEGNLLISSVSDVEDATIVLVRVAEPERAGLIKEVLLELLVPVFILTVELQIIAVSHVVHSQDSILSVHGEVLHSGNG